MAKGTAKAFDEGQDRALAALMVAAQDGDRTAYSRLLQDCEPIIRRAARQAGVVDDRIEDVIQDTLLTLHNARQTYDPARSFSAWLFVIARRRAIDTLRRQGRTRQREVHEPAAYDAAPDSQLDGAGLLVQAGEASALRDAIAGLSPGQREAVERLALREQSLVEASVESGRSIGALKVNMHRALRALRDRLVSREDPPAGQSEEDRHV